MRNEQLKSPHDKRAAAQASFPEIRRARGVTRRSRQRRARQFESYVSRSLPTGEAPKSNWQVALIQNQALFAFTIHSSGGQGARDFPKAMANVVYRADRNGPVRYQHDERCSHLAANEGHLVSDSRPDGMGLDAQFGRHSGRNTAHWMAGIEAWVAPPDDGIRGVLYGRYDCVRFHQ